VRQKNALERLLVARQKVIPQRSIEQHHYE
jgi:hypothetical protein